MEMVVERNKTYKYIQMGNSIALVAASDNGSVPRLHFEVWGNQEKLNPEHWLASK